jgi:aspartyl-tRNA(Asn)/glutamyl-tRNA(Gln) amidotransferase subunit A
MRTITGTIKLLEDKKISSTELVQESFKTIKSKNAEINAFLSTFEDKSLEDAQSSDERRSNEKLKSLIDGIPTSIKDNYNLVDTVTSASSKILENYISPYTATVPQRLIDAGSIVVGKTNMDAFAHGSSTETSDFGVTKNPHDLTKVAGGSSGGAGAAVAAEMSIFAIGSETAGSVRGPAAWCGTVGFTPTYGRFSRYGVVAMGSSLDRPGILANSVEDCALISDLISGQDPKDATSIPENKTNYLENLKTDYTNLKIGLPKQYFDNRIQEEVKVEVMKQVKLLEAKGAKLVEIDLLDPKYSIAVYTIVCRSEVSSNLARIDGIRYGFISDEVAESILDYISNNRGAGFGNEAKQRSMTGAYVLSAGYYDAYYKKAQQVRTLIINDFKKAFESVDLIIAPTMPSTAPEIGVTKDNPLFGELADVLTEPSALAGLPCISIPAGLDNSKMPIGLQIIGPQMKEQEVLNLGATLFDLNK